MIAIYILAIRIFSLVSMCIYLPYIVPQICTYTGDWCTHTYVLHTHIHMYTELYHRQLQLHAGPADQQLLQDIATQLHTYYSYVCALYVIILLQFTSFCVAKYVIATFDHCMLQHVCIYYHAHSHTHRLLQLYLYMNTLYQKDEHIYCIFMLYQSQQLANYVPIAKV